MRYCKIITLFLILALALSSCKSSDIGKAEQIIYSIPVLETTTASYQVIDDENIQLSSIGFKIPKDFRVIEKSAAAPLLESQDGSVQFSVEDKTDTITDFDSYICDTIESLKGMGLSPSETKETDLGSYHAKRFIFDTFDMTSSNVTYYCYFMTIDNSKILVNVISKDGKISSADESDSFVQSIEFN